MTARYRPIRSNLYVHCFGEGLQAFHGLLTRFAFLFDLVFYLFQKEVEFLVDFEQRVIAGNLDRQTAQIRLRMESETLQQT